MRKHKPCVILSKQAVIPGVSREVEPHTLMPAFWRWDSHKQQTLWTQGSHFMSYFNHWNNTGLQSSSLLTPSVPALWETPPKRGERKLSSERKLIFWSRDSLQLFHALYIKVILMQMTLAVCFVTEDLSLYTKLFWNSREWFACLSPQSAGVQAQTTHTYSLCHTQPISLF